MQALMTFEELREAAAKLPTIFLLHEELRLIRGLRALDLADIEEDLPSFIALVEAVQRSHADNGIFEMREAEEAQAIGFFNWLKTLETKLGVPLTSYADGLDLSCAEVARTMPRQP